MLRAVATSPNQDTQYVELTQAEIEERLLEEIYLSQQDTRSPLEKITDLVKQLPVIKRVDPMFGGFMNQCLLAIQFDDIEALGYLIENFQTEDSDYANLKNQVIELFSLTI